MAASLQLTAYEVTGSVNVENNTSQLFVRLQITTSNGTYNQSGDTTGTITVNGQSYNLNGKTVGYNTTTVLYEKTHTITHNADGSKSVTVAARFDPNTPATSEMTASKTVALTSIPRASTVAATAADIGAVSMVAVNRHSSAYTHSISWKFVGLSGWLKADGSVANKEEKLTATAIGFTLPESFYAQIPNSSSDVCTLTCTTYLENTPIGETQTAQFKVTANADICRPQVSVVITDSNSATAALTGNTSVMVRHASTALCQINAAAQKNATIVSKVIAGQKVTGNSLSISGFAADSVSGTITDSRGYTASFVRQIQTIPYIPLTANVTAGRTDPTSGNATVVVTGNYFNGNFGAKNNTLQVLCKVGSQQKTLTASLSGGTYRAVGEFSGLDYQLSHSVTVTVKDALKELSKTATIGKGVPVFDWGEKDFQFNVPVTVQNPTADNHVASVGYLKNTALLKTGGTMTGILKVPSDFTVQSDGYPTIYFTDTDDNVTKGAIIGDMLWRRVYARSYAEDTSYYENFIFPTASTGLTENKHHTILTTKSLVTVAQGGTGAGNAKAARNNLGLGCTKLLSGVGSVGGHGNYKMYLVMGRPAQNASIMTLLIPASELTTSAVRYQIADSTDYVSFNLSVSGTTLTISKVAGNGTITAVYGIN